MLWNISSALRHITGILSLSRLTSYSCHFGSHGLVGGLGSATSIIRRGQGKATPERKDLASPQLTISTIMARGRLAR